MVHSCPKNTEKLIAKYITNFDTTKSAELS